MSNPTYVISISTQPLSGGFIIGGTCTLSVVAATTPPGGTLTYQWNKAGTPITGATNASLILSSMTATDAASYTCTVSCSGSVDVVSSAAVLVLDSIVAAIIRNRKAALAVISTTNGASFTPLAVEEERLTLNINGRYPYGLLLKAPIEPNEEDNRRDEVDIAIMICWFFLYNDDDQTLDEITYQYRNVVADTVKAWMLDRTIGGLMEGTRMVGNDQGVAEDNKGNLCYRVDVAFHVHGFIDSDNPYLKG